jgi:hypothetical protein
MWNQVLNSLEDSTARVMSRLAALLPGIVAFVLAVLIFALIGWLLAWIARRILVSLRFDDRFGRGTETLSEWSPKQTPTRLIAGIIFWFLFVIGIAVGVESFGASSNSVVATAVLAYLPKLVGAIVILIAGTLIARVLSRGVLIGGVNMNLQYARILSLGVKWLVLVLTAAMTLDHLQIGEAIVDLAFGILFGGIVLALALAVGLGSRDLVSRSLERETVRAAPPPEPAMEEQVRHF